MSETEANIVRVQISFRLPEPLKNQFLGKVKGRGLDVTDILTSFVESYVAGSTTPATPQPQGAKGEPNQDIPPELRPALHKCAEILASGDQMIIEAVVSNIEVFHDRRKPASAHGGDHKARPHRNAAL